MDSPLVREYLVKLKAEDRFLTVNEWIPWVKMKYAPEQFEYGLSLGCGDGSLERNAIQIGICAHMDAFDISTNSIEIAKRLSQEHGIASQIHYQQADVNTIRLPEGKYDIVFGGLALHHFKNLEHIFAGIKKSLKPEGLFVINEFVGPSQFQWTEKQVSIINELLSMLPERLRIDVRSEVLKQACWQPTIEFMNEHDPSEAIRSHDIVPLVDKMFTIVERVDFGGTLLHNAFRWNRCEF